MRHIYSSVDIGTDTIKVVVTELYKGKLNLLAASSIKSKGIKKGLIADVKLAFDSIKLAINEVEDMLGFRLKKFLVNIPSYLAEFVKVDGVLKIDTPDLIINGSHVSKVLEKSLLENNFSKEIVSIIPIDFSVDQQSGIRDPKGLMGDTLSVRAIAVLVPKKNIYSVVSLFDSLGLEVVDISLNEIGDINTFKNKDIENKLGAVINVGYDTTNVSVYNRGILIKNSIICMGGRSIDNDLSYMYKIDIDVANKVKEDFAFAHKKCANKQEFYTVFDDLKINQFEVTEVVMSRIEEILTLSKKEINDLANRKMDYIIVTGGVSNMDGFSFVANDVFGKDTVIGNVNIIGIRDNRYSSCIGNIVYYINRLKLFGIDDSMVEDVSFMESNINESMLGKVFGYFFGDTNEEEM